ncbi:hypothetical protein LRQ11_00795, partial [Pseudomonas sp. MAFF 311095]|uniref:hypothetical protein n=1 Tax=Pseudomonas petroselini TaxID=2899822 RepID=UPI0020B1BE4D
NNSALNVGGGLLPIAVYLLIDLLLDPPLSGASPLPHWIFGVLKAEVITQGLDPCKLRLFG